MHVGVLSVFTNVFLINRGTTLMQGCTYTQCLHIHSVCRGAEKICIIKIKGQVNV